MSQPQAGSTDRHRLLLTDTRWFTVKEIADIVDMSVSWVYDEISSRRIRAVRRGKRIKVSRREAERLDDEMLTQEAE